MRKSLALTILALMLVPAMAYGQAQKGSISVTVQAEDGSRLPGVSVEAGSDETLTKRSAITGEDGVALLAAMDPASNYTVTTSLDGFNGSRNENVLVKAGQTTPIRVNLSLATVTEEVIVTAESPVVDVTSAVTGQEITLQLTEALPTARSYQDYLQLVPGVQATIGGGANPASRSGINYSDIGGSIGSSSDNYYYFEGINVTDNVTGTFGANLNTEIIQEQSVLTGGLPAEFVGATGLVSNVITKSGGNDFSGSINYYHQDDSLVADNDHEPDATFSRFDTALTLGGPIVQDKAWFFASYRKTNREQDIVSNDGIFQRRPTREADQTFAKVTWAATQSDLISGLFLSDPQDEDGSFNNEATNARDRSRDQGGDRFSVNYSRVWSALVFELGFTDHEGDLNDSASAFSPPGSRNNVAFLFGEDFAAADEQLGGYGFNFLDTRSNNSFKGSLEYLASTSWGDHTLKGGVEISENEHFRNNLTIGNASYTSLSGNYLGLNVTANDVSGGSRVSFDPNNTSDFNGFVSGVNNSPGRDAIIAALDSDGDGALSPGEVGNNLHFNTLNSETGDGSLFYDRTAQVQDGAQITNSEGTTYYIQDNWQYGKFSANIGIRAEEWEHFDTTGRNIYTFDTEIAPRVSLVYDLKGNGRQRISAYYGRYYDPIRNNMTNFAGSVTGRVREEQVRVDVAGFNDWVPYRTRGGATQPDAFFAPATETPYTEEAQIGYKIDLGRNMSFETNLITRSTTDILEDYDLSLYARPDFYGLPVDDPESLFLGLGHFGYTDFPVDGNGNEANFIIATLAGGERDWDGVELVFRKRMSNHWQMLASYNYADGEGNTNSDSNADFQGDVLWLDPRAPNQNGVQPGLVEHLFKIAGTYQFDNGISLGGKYRWNSGAIASRTFRASGRNLPLLDIQDTHFDEDGVLQAAAGNDVIVDPINFAGQEGFWISPFAVGAVDNPSYGILDLRLSYLWRLSGRWEADFFLDVFNVLDEQDITQSQDLVRGGSGVSFGGGLEFVEPQRFFLGARLRF
ncbi:MAG: carboxypeptidase regulatory-like domain-containing protein [Deltaproteobacteria bacterium]|nr:carboxypeptidase regulatory-like domain-containing protein [Deltaproteobacteria bacterium]